MKKLLFILIVGMLQSSWAIAQSNGAEILPDEHFSLKDTVKVIQLKELAWELKNQNPDSALIHIDHAIRISKAISYTRGLAEGYKTKGVIKWYQSNLELARMYMNKALSYYEKLSARQGIADVYNNIGLTYHISGEYGDARESYLKALEIREEIGDKTGIAASHNNLGVVFYQMGDYDKALQNHTQALQIREETIDMENLPDSYINVGNIYMLTGEFDKALDNFNKALAIQQEVGDKRGQADAYHSIGSALEEREDYKHALENYHNSLALMEDLEDKAGMSEDLSSIGEVYYAQQNYRKALTYFEKALEISTAIDNRLGMVKAYNNIGHLYTQLKDPAKSVRNLNKSIELARELGTKPSLRAAFRYLSTAYGQMGKYKDAFEAQKQFIVLNDSILDEETARSLTNQQTKYESEKKEKEIALLNKDKQIERNRNYFLLAGLILILAIAGQLLIGNLRKIKTNRLLATQNHEILSQKEEIDLQNHQLELKNSALEQLNQEKNDLMGVVAHDLKNPLSQIKGLVNIVLMDAEALSPMHQDFVGKIGESAERLTEMIHRILDVEAIESATLNLNIENNNIYKLMSTTLREYAREAERKSIEIHFEGDLQSGHAWSDEGYTRQIFDNLVSNALKFSPAERNLYVTVERVGTRIRTTVRDEGPGLSEDDMKKLFGRFQKLSARPTGGENSSGLGLSIVKKYVEAMDGKVWCVSDLGKGAAFIVEFNEAPVPEPV